MDEKNKCVDKINIFSENRLSGGKKAMYIRINLGRLVDVTSVYMVKRRTVWQIVDHDTLLIFCSDGHCRITMDGEEYLLSPGSLIIIPAGHHYLRQPIGNEMCSLYYFHIHFRDDTELCDDATAAEAMALQKQSHAETALRGEAQSGHEYYLRIMTDLSLMIDEVLGIYDEAIKTAVRDHAESPTKLSLLAARLLMQAAEAALRENTELMTRPVSPNKKLRKVFAYIRLHSKENITLDDLCAVSNFSRQHLIRVFRTELGMTPKAYILTYRINCAKELFFRDRTLSVKEVAYELGFEDQHYFTRLFSKVTGQTPSAYRDHLINFDPDKQ